MYLSAHGVDGKYLHEVQYLTKTSKAQTFNFKGELVSWSITARVWNPAQNGAWHLDSLSKMELRTEEVLHSMDQRVFTFFRNRSGTISKAPPAVKRARTDSGMSVTSDIPQQPATNANAGVQQLMAASTVRGL